MKVFEDCKVNVTQKLKFVLREKTFWEKGKMLVTSIFFFSLNVFHFVKKLVIYQLNHV